MKRTVSFLILLSILITPTLSFADWEIVDNSFEYLYEPSWTLRGDVVGLIYKITNQIDPDEVERAIKSVDRRFPLNFDFRVHIMDFSYGHHMVSGLVYDDENIIIFDYLPFKSRVLVHDVVAHEIGHLVYNRMSECEIEVYKEIRGIPDSWTDKSEYVNRPTEIFAEDFRILFGSRYAREFQHFNRILRSPERIYGLEEFIETINIR